MKLFGDVRVKVARLQFGTSKASAIAMLVKILTHLLGSVSAIHHGFELIGAVSMAAIVWGAYDAA